MTSEIRGGARIPGRRASQLATDSERILDSLDRLLERTPPERVVFCGRRTSPPPYAYIVNFPRLELPLSGRYEMDVELGGRPRLIAPGPGTAIFAAPNCWNRPTWERPVRVMSILFGKKQTGISLVTAGGPPGTELSARKIAVSRRFTGPAEKILSAILELHGSGVSYGAYPELIHALLHSVRVLLVGPMPARKSRGKGLMEEVLVFLQQNYQRSISRELTASEFGITPNHLSRIFKIHGFMTFKDYLAYVRIDRAKYLLKTYRLRVEEIAGLCGFREAAYFCRVFKRLTKRTPSDYREEIPSSLPG